jgi:hypothetical protein
MPDLITRIAAVPLTGNGKPDRAAAKRLLDPPADPHDAPQPTHADPRTTHEPVAV